MEKDGRKVVVGLESGNVVHGDALFYAVGKLILHWLVSIVHAMISLVASCILLVADCSAL